MLQSSLNGWLKKPKQPEQRPGPLPPASSAPNRPPPPPKSASAPARVPPAAASSTPTMDNWNDIPDDFLQPPSRPRSKKSPTFLAQCYACRNSESRHPVQPSRPAAFHPTAVRSSSTACERPTRTTYRGAYARIQAPERAHITHPVSRELLQGDDDGTTPQYNNGGVMALNTCPNGSNGAQPEQPLLVGAIRCRLLPSSQLYISTLGILAPYRSHGIAMHLLQVIVKKAVELHNVRCVTAHVWEANEEGLEWYKKRNFETLAKEEHYYRKLKPQSAFLVRKWIGVGDLLGSGATEENGRVI